MGNDMWIRNRSLTDTEALAIIRPALLLYLRNHKPERIYVSGDTVGWRDSEGLHTCEIYFTLYSYDSIFSHYCGCEWMKTIRDGIATEIKAKQR